ncbi:MAG: hypothetical protein J3K34DRAFT_80647 [Monoraphidium minutum]|nr:MAG: hypothetical protein J3K34DRAFT_80647 [Monoraphidium minutum]
MNRGPTLLSSQDRISRPDRSDASQGEPRGARGRGAGGRAASGTPRQGRERHSASGTPQPPRRPGGRAGRPMQRRRGNSYASIEAQGPQPLPRRRRGQGVCWQAQARCVYIRGEPKQHASLHAPTTTRRKRARPRATAAGAPRSTVRGARHGRAPPGGAGGRSEADTGESRAVHPTGRRPLACAPPRGRPPGMWVRRRGARAGGEQRSLMEGDGGGGAARGARRRPQGRQTRGASARAFAGGGAAAAGVMWWGRRAGPPAQEPAGRPPLPGFGRSLSLANPRTPPSPLPPLRTPRRRRPRSPESAAAAAARSWQQACDRGGGALRAAGPPPQRCWRSRARPRRSPKGCCRRRPSPRCRRRRPAARGCPGSRTG